MRSWFSSTLGALQGIEPGLVVGQLSAAAADRRLGANPESTDSWRTTVHCLRTLAGFLVEKLPEASEWHVGLEFELPRRRRRIDVVILARDLIFILETKAGAQEFERASRWQVEQYALDLRDFHAGSHNRMIVPLLLATAALSNETREVSVVESVREVRGVNCEGLGQELLATLMRLSDPLQAPLAGSDWENSDYRPTPSIIEAAQLLFRDHDVREISASGSSNLDETVGAVVEIAARCRAEHHRGIAFITGSPGSGKTLAGLQVAHDPQLMRDGEESAVFLSGNMPLVEVISKALATSGAKDGTSHQESQRRIGASIQHAFAYRNEYAEHPSRIPSDHVVLFDEAQRAWDRTQVERWTRGQSRRSEPQILLDVMSRVEDWSLVIAMVGGGQEINRGEAGLAEWGRALAEHHPDWLVFAADAVLPGAPDRPGGRLFDVAPEAAISVERDQRLHLTMNVRSPRAERLNQWVDALLSLDASEAMRNLPPVQEFPLVMTRELEVAKAWLRDRANSDMRTGLVASADARRLRAWGLETNLLKQERAWADWFLREEGDVRSSYQLEVPATNFDCQGLELDWVGVCWGNDLVPVQGLRQWQVRQFRGSRWVNANDERRRYILNSYRVLLTRARRGQIIWVPRPDGSDSTLEPQLFDQIAGLLQATGVPLLD